MGVAVVAWASARAGRHVAPSRWWWLPAAIPAAAVGLSGVTGAWLAALAVPVLAAGPGLLLTRRGLAGPAPWPVVLGLGLAALSSAGFLALVAGQFTPWALAGLGLAAGAVAGREWPRGLRAGVVATAPTAGERAAAGLLAALLTLVVLQAAVPDCCFDPVWAHLPLAEALAEGRYRLVPDVWWTGIPLGYHVLAALAHAVAGGMAAKLLHTVFLLLATGWAVWMGARLHGLRAGLIAGLLFLTIPLVMWDGAVGNTDMAAAFLGVAGVTAALEFLAGAGRGWLLAAGTLIGAAAAVKPFALTLAVPLGLLVVHGRGAGSVLPLVAGLVLTAGPWLARMWLATGNPVFPAFPGLFGSPDAGTAIEAGSRSVPFRTAFPWTVERVVALPFLLTFRASSLAPTADGSMGTYPLLWLPVLIARWRAVGGAERRLLGVAAGYFIGVAAFAPEPRYLLPTWLLLAPVLGAVLAPLAQPGGAATGTERLALGTVLLAGLGYTLLAWLSMFPAQASLDYLTGRLDRDGYLRQTVPALDIFDDVQRLVPPGALVLTDGLSTTYHAKRYLLPSWLPSVRPLFGPSLTRDEADRLLRARDARYFLALSAGRYPLVELGLARPLVSEGGFTLYELARP